jgi:hypothetical protein
MEMIFIFRLLLSIAATIFTILSVVLFFKIWGMTNNVKQIKNILDLMMRNQFKDKTNN